jgi:D-arabinose 1-dehydrogenase-like Zn-dependent alcohol dehydrogenase
MTMWFTMPTAGKAAQLICGATLAWAAMTAPALAAIEALMILGFGGAGMALRRRKALVVA